jgi:hypothetical protein
MRWLIFGTAVTAGILGMMPVSGHAQFAAQSTLPTIERQQRLQLEGNRNIISNQLQDRYQNSLELEKQFYDENRRRREDYRFQGNAQQRALETQLRQEDQRIRQNDQRNREFQDKQRLEELQGQEQMRRNLGN